MSLTVNFCCSGYPCRPIIWLSLSRGRMGQAIHRTQTGSSAVLLCRATHSVRQPNRCRALGQSTLTKFTLLQLMSLFFFAIYLVASIQVNGVFHEKNLKVAPKLHPGKIRVSLLALTCKFLGCGWELSHWCWKQILTCKKKHTPCRDFPFCSLLLETIFFEIKVFLFKEGKIWI